MKQILLSLGLLALGLFLISRGVVGAVWMGEKWFTTNALDPWWMMPTFYVTAQFAYVWFAIAPMIVGGVIGAAAVVLTWLRHPKTAITFIFASIAVSALAFNTFDWMISYETGLGGSPNFVGVWNFFMPNLMINAWLFYFFCIIVPLWVGGFLATSPVLYWAKQKT